MGALTDSTAQARKLKPRSKKPGSSSVPSSVPDFALLTTIDALKAELAELKQSGLATAAEIASLKTKLAAAEAKAADAPPTITRTDDTQERKSFFGL